MVRILSQQWGKAKLWSQGSELYDLVSRLLNAAFRPQPAELGFKVVRDFNLPSGCSVMMLTLRNDVSQVQRRLSLSNPDQGSLIREETDCLARCAETLDAISSKCVCRENDEVH